MLKDVGRDEDWKRANMEENNMEENNIGFRMNNSNYVLLPN